MPSEVFLSSASSSSLGSEKFSNTSLVSSSPILLNEGCIDSRTFSPSSMRLPAMSSTEILLSPIASLMPVTTMLFSQSVISCVLNDELVPESSCMNTNGSFTLNA